MQITAYKFGSIEIDGQTYSSDVVIFSEHVYSDWWRKQGHSLDIKDLAEVLKAKPEILLVGTGYFGRMQVPEKTVTELRKNGIKTVSYPTSEAVKEFNKLQQQCANIAAALHLTC